MKERALSSLLLTLRAIPISVLLKHHPWLPLCVVDGRVGVLRRRAERAATQVHQEAKAAVVVSRKPPGCVFRKVRLRPCVALSRPRLR
ncbi:hypothetical protein I7I53_11820 [Histoplasma capsulatum var. duboisii H88]|uniref:Secreted protein n=1 Tax=Ajellomyces capsulatus (strain H88) TaxID=544711 RepID=A0A8A1LWI6_AJEC8|nr:hypothetical protein I7I53_11820 [Histoplasma capsulatum var. duboisii H88]